MTRARRELVDPETTPYYHCICRCVRRAFLCGTDSLTGKNYEHRKGWVVERLRTLQKVFAIELFAYAVMSNHYHLVVRLNAGEAEGWTDYEVMERWGRLFSLPLLVERYRRGDSTQAEAVKAKELIETWRERLADLSWFMRSLNEYLARRANAEDGCKGRFWEGRFKSQALLDEAAVLTCMSYVDLNPVRAGVADRPESSDFTSIQQRIEQYVKDAAREPEGETGRPRLAHLAAPTGDTHKNAFALSTEDYLKLVDWAGRAIRDDKRGAISAGLPPILARLELAPGEYLEYVRYGRREYHVSALGSVARLREVADRVGRRFLKGLGLSRRLYLREA